MPFVYPNLVSMMKRRNLECQDIAALLGLKYHAAYRRLRGQAEWKLCETIYLCKYFGISDTVWLFKREDTITQNS